MIPISEASKLVGCSRESLQKAVARHELAGELRGNVLYVGLRDARRWWARPRKRAGRKAKAGRK
jgi:hypothetical protein